MPASPSSRDGVRRPASWSLADVIDFEHFLALGSAEVQADRDLFEQKIAPQLPPEALTRRPAVFRAWLEAHRAQSEPPTPGDCFETGWRALLSLALFGGLLLGGGLAGSLLAYSGSEPINALTFFATTAGLQMVLLLAGLLAWAGRRWLGEFFGGFGPLRALLGLTLAALGAGLRQLPGERRDRVRSALGVLDRRRDLYGALAQWPLLTVTQLFAVAFNVGILAMMLLIHLPLEEKRFGWQSTYRISPEQLFGVVSTLAAPWKWALPHAHPTESEVKESRYNHGQDAQTLPPDAARAWWPFLAGAVAAYGLLPRLVLLATAVHKTRRGVRELRFDHAEANALWRRLTGPLLTVTGGEEKLDESAPPAPRSALGVSQGECLALAAKEIALSEAALRDLLSRQYGWRLRALLPAQIDSRRESAALLDQVRAGSADLASVVVIVPESRDPIMAVGLFLKEVEAAAGEHPEVLVLLTGAANRASDFAPVDEERFEIWQRFKNIQRLRAGLERWPSKTA